MPVVAWRCNTPPLHPATSHAYPVITLCFVIIMVCGGVEWIQLAQFLTDSWKSVNFLIPLKTWNFLKTAGYTATFEGTLCAMELGAEHFRKCALCCVRLRVFMLWQVLKQQHGYSERGISHSGPLRSGLSGHSCSRSPRSWPDSERNAVRGTPADATTCSTVDWNTKHLTYTATVYVKQLLLPAASSR